MGADLPPELAVLLDGPDPAARDGAWARFLDRYNRLLLKAAGGYGGDYDARMDRYRHLVESLAADDFRRLRSYHHQARSSFPSWLTVVARRLCVDYDRAHHGRGGRTTLRPDDAEANRRLRRRLAGGGVADLDPDLLPANTPDEASRLAEAERHQALHAVMAELEPRDRLLLRLRFDDGRSVREIADVLEYPTVFHVYRRLHAVLGTVRQQLERRGVRGERP